MKTKSIKAKLLGVVTFLLVLQSSTGSAQSNIHLELYKPNTSIAEIKVDNLSENEVIKVTIKNEYGTVLFSDQSNGERYLKMVDFGNIRNGVYYVDVAKEGGLVRKLIVKSENGLSIGEEAYVFHNFVKYKEDDKKLLVKFNNELKEPVTLRITDNLGRVVHEEAGIKAESYATLFNLSKLHKGSYNMTVTSGNFSNFKQIQL